MSAFMQVIGGIVVAALAIAAALTAFGYLMDRQRRLVERIGGRSWSESRRVLGVQLSREHYWFSAHKEAQRILLALGKALTDDANYEVSRLRDDFEKDSTP